MVDAHPRAQSTVASRTESTSPRVNAGARAPRGTHLLPQTVVEIGKHRRPSFAREHIRCVIASAAATGDASAAIGASTSPITTAAAPS